MVILCPLLGALYFGLMPEQSIAGIDIDRYAFLPARLADTSDPKYPPDPDDLIDPHAGYFTRIVQSCEDHTVSEWPDIAVTNYPDHRHLSRSSREAPAMLSIAERAWSKGLVRAQSATALTQAAFAVMKPALAARPHPRPALLLGPRHPHPLRARQPGLRGNGAQAAHRAAPLISLVSPPRPA